ncbi:tRNA-dihydrouridine synthase family protein [Luteolibacter algae]|uniref:tRNA-dihydrouridine synthase n=1 Tax=Luteolibacter algae TaxID=454151 RepID=A0ABW5D762_9BACT
MRDFLPADIPALVLAPMQDVTDLPFMRVLGRRSLPDWFVTEYFRVHPDSKLNKYILRSICENETDRPIFAQMIGRDIPNLVRSAKELSQYPIAGIDLNLGCPAPVVCRKDAGGGLLRQPEKIREILGALREAIPGRFTVKTRLGYYDAEEFQSLLEIFRSHEIDGLTIHGRTVLDRYQTPVRPPGVKLAVDTMACPVIANGNVVDVETGLSFHRKTNAAGLMVGRGAIRNPWIFGQLQAAFRGETFKTITHQDLSEYIAELSEELARESVSYDPVLHIQRMKKTLIYISEGIDPEFEHGVRRMKTQTEFQALCDQYLSNKNPLPILPSRDSRIFCGFGDLIDH